MIHTNGVHEVDVLFCDCNLAAKHGNHVQQLLRRRLFPATTTDPQTASSFAILESSHVLSVQSKLSLYDLYISIETLTDAARISLPKVCSELPDSCTVCLTVTQEPLSRVSLDAQGVAPFAFVEAGRKGA